MEPVAYAVDRIKGFAKSSEGFLVGAFRRRSDSSRQNPIQILKRLQRELFSDLMKLRDRQDKVERVLSFYKTGKGGPFQEVSTHMKGTVDVAGALLIAKNDHQQACDMLHKEGRRIGINSRFIFETAVRQKDILIAEIAASQHIMGFLGHGLGSPLVLEKVKYLANVNDQLSVISVPLGAKSHDFEISSSVPKGLPPFGPPLFNQWHNCAAGLMVRGSRFAASFGELFSQLGATTDGAAIGNCFHTFGQLAYEPFDEVRFTLSGIWQTSKRPSPLIKLGPLAVPLGTSNLNRISNVQAASSSSSATNQGTGHSFALMLESTFEESTKIQTWMEVQKSSPGLLQWGLSFSDDPEDELGWGLRASGKMEGHSWRYCLEGHLNINLGKKFNLQPGLMYMMGDNAGVPAFFCRSSWSM